MSDNTKSILFAVAMCLVCGTLLTTAATGLQKIQEKNVENDRRKNILLAVDLVSSNKSYTPSEIEKIYENNIVSFGVNDAGAIVAAEKTETKQVLPLYIYSKNGSVGAYIIPIETQGLWGKIYGYLALKNDGSTVAGFTVYQHSETPGLGGEIEKRWFQENFAGKKIVDQTGNFVSVKVAKGDVEKQLPESKEPHYVDGISGATLTGKYLSQGLQQTLSEYEPVSVSFRKNRLRCRIQEKPAWCDDEETDTN